MLTRQLVTMRYDQILELAGRAKQDSYIHIILERELQGGFN